MLDRVGDSVVVADEVGVSLMFSDIEGSTRLWEADQAAMSQAVPRHDVLLRAAIERAEGSVSKTVGDATSKVNVLGNIGYRELLAKNSESARAHLEGALATATELNLSREVVICRMNLGLAEFTGNDHLAAMQLFQDAARGAWNLADRPLSAYALLGAALCAEADTDLATASMLHGAADSLFEQLGILPDAMENELRSASQKRLRDLLSGSQFDALHRSGRALSAKAAIHVVIATNLGTDRGIPTMPGASTAV